MCYTSGLSRLAKDINVRRGENSLSASHATFVPIAIDSSNQDDGFAFHQRKFHRRLRLKIKFSLRLAFLDVWKGSGRGTGSPGRLSSSSAPPSGSECVGDFALGNNFHVRNGENPNHCVSLAFEPIAVDLPLNVDDVAFLESEFAVILRLKVVEGPGDHLVARLTRLRDRRWGHVIHVVVAIERNWALLGRAANTRYIPV